MIKKTSVLVFVLIILLSSCTPATDNANYITVPNDDSTAPTVGMTIYDSKMNIDITEKSNPITFEASSGIVPILVGATDIDGGIKVVRLWKTVTKFKPDDIEGSGLQSAPEMQDVSTANVGELTLKNRFFKYDLNLSQELGDWAWIKVDVWAEGENFYGGIVSTPKISIKYPSALNAEVVSICSRTGGPPEIKLDDNVIRIGQEPGRQLIGYAMKNNVDALLIIVDDAPGLPKNQMRVELDIDPYNEVLQNKAIEAWGFCQRGSRVDVVEASILGGFGVGIASLPLNAGNDFRSNVTNSQTMVLDRSTTSELWFRKMGFLGIWSDAEVIDSSIWEAFSWRSVRFIWRFDIPPAP